MWRCVPITPALTRLRQKHPFEFEATLVTQRVPGQAELQYKPLSQKEKKKKKTIPKRKAKS